MVLTHSPAYCRYYSDNAALTRARAKGIAACVSATSEAGLTTGQGHMILLCIQAKTGQELVSDKYSWCH